MAAWQFGSTVMPTPSTYERVQSWEPLTTTTRAINGTLRVDRWGTGRVYDHLLQWDTLTTAEWTTIQTAFASGPTNTFEDGSSGTWSVYWAELERSQANVNVYGLSVRLTGAVAV
jgi:hypothetical protein